MSTKAIQVCMLLTATAVSVLSIDQPLQDGDALDQLQSIIQRQEGQIQQLEDKIQQQNDKIRQQQDDNQQQNDKIRQQQDDNQQQNDKMQQQEEVIGMLLQMMKANTESIAILEKRLEKETSEKNSLNSLTPDNKSEKILIKRSDDTNSLEIVVNEVSQRLNGVTAQIQSLKAKDEVLSVGITEAKGSVYTRWGSSSCANTSELVYSGFIGGSYFSHSGGATNALCLPPNPVYAGNAHSNMDYGYAALYGGEYEVSPESSNNLDGVCAVCQAARASTVMIPATNVCNPGWDLQYTGFIMANRPDDGRTGTEYICVDSKLEGRVGGAGANHNQFVLYYTQSHCGSLPCPPYEEGKVVTCVVCSK